MDVEAQAKRDKRLAYLKEWRVKNHEKIQAYEKARGPSTPRTKAYYHRKCAAKKESHVDVETENSNEISSQV
jgi:hypothetical protein